MTFAEMDNCFIRAIRYLHSASNESQHNIRLLLDEAVKSKYGSGKDPLSSLNISSDFALFQEYAVINTLESVKDDMKTGSSSDNELELDLLKEDLMCVVCKGMGVGARNRLVECSDCHFLYHQECHDPFISEEEIESSATWTCNTCKDMQLSKAMRKPIQNSIGAVISTHKSSITNPMFVPSKSYNDKDYSDISSSKSIGSKSSPGSSSKSSSVSNRVITPNINLVSADKRLQIMKKKAAKMQEKRKLSR